MRQQKDNETMQEEHVADMATMSSLRENMEGMKKRYEENLAIARMSCEQGMIVADECLAQPTKSDVAPLNALFGARIQQMDANGTDRPFKQPEDKYYEVDAECEVESKLKAAQQRKADMRVGHAAELNTLT